MKTRKLLLVLILVVIFLLGTVLVANANNKVRLTGGINNSFFGFGWEWMVANVSLDPASFNAEGKVQYMVYTDDVGPAYRESWVGEPVCGALGDIGGVPTIALVLKITDVKNIDPYWIDKYMKVTLSDGGQNGSEDMIGIVVFDLVNNQPVPDQPECEFEAPLIMYPSLNGNLTIHD